MDHAKTEPEIIIDSAKTDGEIVEENPVIIERPADDTIGAGRCERTAYLAGRRLRFAP